MDNTVIKVCQLSTMEPSTRPATRAKAYGCSSLTDDELLTIILGSRDLCKYAHRDLAEMTIPQMTANGISTTAAIKIDALKEYCQRMMTPPDMTSLNSTESVAKYLRPSMQNLQQEEFRVLFLNSNHKLIEDRVMTTGTVDMSLVSVREILTYALRLGASNLIISHNHPNGVSLPSSEDHDVTELLNNGCRSVGMHLTDHVIIGGDGGYYSFRERGFLS